MHVHMLCMYACVLYVRMYAYMHVPHIGVGNLCRAKCGLLLDPLSNGGAPLKFPGLPLSNFRIPLKFSGPSQIFGSSQIRGTCPLRFSAPLKPLLSDFRLLLSVSADLLSEFGAAQILGGSLWNLRASQNLRGVL